MAFDRAAFAASEAQEHAAVEKFGQLVPLKGSSADAREHGCRARPESPRVLRCANSRTRRLLHLREQ